LPEANVISALGLFGETPAEAVADSLPADPAEWLASLGAATTDDEGVEESLDE